MKATYKGVDLVVTPLTLSDALQAYVAAVQGFFHSLNQMAVQDPHHTLHHPVHGTSVLKKYMKTQALTEELEHICNVAKDYTQTLSHTQWSGLIVPVIYTWINFIDIYLLGSLNSFKYSSPSS